MKILSRIEIPHYIREVKLSNNQRPVYWEWTGDLIHRVKRNNVLLPPKFLINRNTPPTRGNIKPEYGLALYKNSKKVGMLESTAIYDTSYNYYLVELATGELVVANPNKAGTPKYKTIRGNDLFSNMDEHTRGKIMEDIKTTFRGAVIASPVITEYPIGIITELHDTIKNELELSNEEFGGVWDVDNRGVIYNKAFLDLLQEMGKIPNDDRLHVTIPPHTQFVPINYGEVRKLVFIVYKDERDCIISNSVYNGTYFEPITIPKIKDET
jgi:hypothetical protein